ncbi:uncharacterized protein LOC128246996 [Octopus bimaculoides]|uniref:uncharacterized protein LOC128246996 n=1 Tax=Octopus bimaculoides TaxID=37653 RepID=UPI0022E7D601|nr:uncharacterized protein LOC128246996 [Octopus bimaculoides]
MFANATVTATTATTIITITISTTALISTLMQKDSHTALYQALLSCENYGDKGSTSCSKSHISLETLFRNATVQQNTFDLKATSVPSRNAHIHRSNMLLESDPATSQLPTILKQFGSSVTMVEDIEKQPQHHGKCENTTSPSTLMLKQLSPSLVTASSHNGFNLLKSSQNYHEFDNISRKTSSKGTSAISINKGVNLLDPVSFSSTTSLTTSGQIFNFPQSPKIGFENSYSNSTECLRDSSNFEPFSSSQSSYAFHGINHFNGPDFTSSLLTIGLDSSIGSKPMKSPVLAKSCTQELLTPADLESVSLPNSFGSISSTLPQHTNNNLLSPMAFVLQQTKAKSVSSSSSNSPVFTKIVSDHHCLTEMPSFSREQLQETMINLLKNDSGFLNKIHQAYLLSLKAELSNP